MPTPTPVDRIRTICNVGHGLETRYARRYQRALDAVLALVEPHDQPRPPGYSNTRGGSEYGRGFADGLRAQAGAILAELEHALLVPDDEEAADGGEVA